MAKRRRWADALTIYRERVFCPNTLPDGSICGCLDYSKVRTMDNGDGSVTKLVACRACGHPFKVVLELPVLGKVKTGEAIIEPVTNPRRVSTC